jgi:ArsR family transcriptional regulator
VATETNLSSAYMNILTPPPVFGHLGTLGDVTRCRLLAVLERREYSVSELCQALQLPQPTVSRHLRVLAEDGWVTARSDGTRRPYRRIDDLAPDQSRLWEIVREQLSADGRLAADLERAEAVLAQRQDRARDFFSASAERWDEIRAELYGIRADLLPLFGLLDPAWSVADLGAGTGVLASAIAPFVSRVVVVDRSPEMLSAARRRLTGTDNVSFHQGELQALPLPAESIDLAMLSLVLHHVPEPDVVLEEVRRVLRPGGRLIIVDMREHDRVELGEEMGHLWPGFDGPRMTRWLEDAGLRPSSWVPLRPDPAGRGPLLFLQSAVRLPEHPTPSLSGA